MGGLAPGQLKSRRGWHSSPRRLHYRFSFFDRVSRTHCGKNSINFAGMAHSHRHRLAAAWPSLVRQIGPVLRRRRQAMAQLVMVHILLVFVPAVASAQAGAALTGIVTDSSGAVLPGVTVEARSPALIEQVRSAVTDETGRYRIVDLRPGTYSVTFTLPGFTTVSREGIELSGAFIANVNAELRVGAVQDAVTVTGETPVVDTQSTKTQETLQNEVLASIPTGRQYYSLTTLLPALNVQGNDVAGIQRPIFIVFQAHAGRRNEGQVHVEG